MQRRACSPMSNGSLANRQIRPFKQCRPFKQSRPSKQRGVVAIEFALGGLVLILTVFAIFEISRFIYITTLVESALRESARDSKVVMTDNYDSLIEQRFEQENAIWHYLVEPNQFRFQSRYFANVSDLANNLSTQGCRHANPDNGSAQAYCPLVEFELSYTYQPMFILAGAASRDIKRRMVVVQEHQGWYRSE